MKTTTLDKPQKVRVSRTKKTTHPLGPVTDELLALTPSVPVDVLCEAMSRVKFYEEQIKELRGLLKQQMVAWIYKNGPFRFGDDKWYIGKKKSHKIGDRNALLQAVFEKAGGDMDRVGAALTSDPFKISDLRELLGDDFEKYVTEREEDEPKAGKATKSEMPVLPHVPALPPGQELRSIPGLVLDRLARGRRAAAEAAGVAGKGSGPFPAA